MAEKATVAFGRYLRELRERRGLSLLQVSRLSEGLPQRIDKGTLSHCERGQQRFSLFKLITLSRIYRVPTDVFIERLELDNEVDRLGGPATEGRDFAELLQAARTALLQESRKWDAYALVRDAAHENGNTGPELTPEEFGLARMKLAIVARSLGKNRLALHELEELETGRVVGDRRHAILLERISHCHRCLGDFRNADRYAVEAIEEARFHDEKGILAFAQLSKASLSLDQGDFGQGRDEFRSALKTYRTASEGDLFSENPMFEAGVLLKLAEADINVKEFGRARRIALAAKRISRTHGLPIGLAYSELLLGKIDEQDDAVDRATCRWTEAVRIARLLNNVRLEFSAEFHILSQAVRRGERALARAACRRMERLAPRVPENQPLLREFDQLKAESRIH